MQHIINPRSFLQISLLAVVLATGCTDDTTDDFVGTWAYSGGMFVVDCNGQLMQFPLDATLTETIVLGSDRDLSKSDSMGCADITYDVDGEVASLAPSPQSCTLPMGTSTATSYTITISDDRDTLTTRSAGTFLATGAPAACTFTGEGTLVNQ